MSVNGSCVWSERLGRVSLICGKAALGVLFIGVLGSILTGWLWIFWAIATNYDGTDFGPIGWVGRVIAGSVLVAFTIGVVAGTLALAADALKGK